MAVITVYDDPTTQVPAAAFWNKTSLTYRISTQIYDAVETKSSIRKALNHWASVSVFRFAEVTAPDAKVDIQILLNSGNITKPALGSVDLVKADQLARIHFNVATAKWTNDPNVQADGIYNFFVAALHFIGHALGVGAVEGASASGSAMAETYNRSIKQLGAFEIGQIQSLYPPSGIIATHCENVYLRIDGKNVTEFNANGSGAVNCSFGPTFETKIKTLHHNDGTHSIESVQYPRVCLRLDGRGVVWNADGSGTVNCQLTPGPFEKFYIDSGADGYFSLRATSASFPTACLRMDCRGVSQGGIGIVNCQETGSGYFERFQFV